MPAGTNLAALDAEHETILSGIADSAQKKAGITTGAAAAAAVLQWRSSDSADWSTTYTPGTCPGACQPTLNSPVNGPAAAKMRPFVRCTPIFDPPPLDGSQMRRELEEIAVWGPRDSTLRTADQTEVARFHAQPGVYSWNSIGRQTAERRGLDEVRTAHLLAVLNIAIVESHFASREAKYAITCGGRSRRSRGWKAAAGKVTAWLDPLLTTP